MLKVLQTRERVRSFVGDPLNIHAQFRVPVRANGTHLVRLRDSRTYVNIVTTEKSKKKKEKKKKKKRKKTKKKESRKMQSARKSKVKGRYVRAKGK